MKPSPEWINTDFQRCIDFHGHLCPGLAIGYRAAAVALERLAAARAEDEEIVAVVETDACGADAVQVITGCTFGKGNFIYKDYGKTVFTVVSRSTGKGVRIARKAEARTAQDDAHLALVAKIREGTATEAEKADFRARHHQRARDVLESPVADLFAVTTVEIAMPEKARIEPSENCEKCGEPTMASKLVKTQGRLFCRDCCGNQR